MFSKEELIAEGDRAARLAAVCAKHGELDGATAAKSMARAIARELHERPD